MRRLSSSWSNTLRKLGFKAAAKRQRQAARRCALESLEERHMLTQLVYLGEETSNCPDGCPCSCSQVGVNKADAATTDAGKAQYSSQTQSHPVLMFALEAYSFPTMTELKARLTVGSNAPIDAYFGAAPEEAKVTGGRVVFGIQIDASSMSSGVYNWELDLWLYDDNVNYYSTSYYSNTYSPDYRPLQIVNHDESQYGAGWSMIDDERLVIQDGLAGQPDGVALVTGNNDVTGFYDPSGGVYRREDDPTNFSQLRKDDNGTSAIETDDTYILTDPNGTVSTFDYEGLLQTVVDRNGNPLAAYTYGTGGDADKIVDIQDQAGRDTHFQYDSGLLVAVTDYYGTAGAQTTQYDYYSGTNQLHHMFEPDPDGPGPLTSPTTTYHYNSLGLLDSVIDPRGLESTVAYDQTRRVSSITERCGGVTNITSLQSLATVDLATNDPDEENWAQLLTYLPYFPYASDVAAAFAGTTYETRVVYGEETKIIRDKFGNINYTQDANGTITQYVRDYSNGLLDQVVQPDPNDADSTLTTYYHYNDTGQVTDIYYPIGLEHWHYGAKGQVDTYTDPNSNTTWYDVDSETGNVLSMTQVLGNDDRYFYEGDDLTTTYTYTDGSYGTPMGLVETVTDPNGNVTHYTYNSQGLVDTVVYAEGTDDVVNEHYTYDDRYRVSVFTDGRDQNTTYVYDNLDRLIQRTDPDPDGESELSSPVWNYYYDPNDNQTHIIDPLGNDTEYVYDVRDRPFQVIQPVADPDATPTVTTKDDVSGMSVTGSWSQITSSGSLNGTEYATSGNGASASYTFTGLDANKKYAVEVRWMPSGTPTDYDKNALFEVFGNTATGVNPLNKLRVNLNSKPQGLPDSADLMWQSIGAFSPYSNTLTVKLHDDDNNGKLVIDAVRLVEVGPVTQTEYDCNGNLVKTIDPLNHVTQYDYDNLNRLTMRTDPDPDGPGGPLSSPATHYAYNVLGWLTSMTDPVGNVTDYHYDAMGRQIEEFKGGAQGLTGVLRDASTAPLDTITGASLNSADAGGFFGFDTLPDGFSFTLTGAIYLSDSGERHFWLENSDHAELYIDDQLFVENTAPDVGSWEQDAVASFTAGWHTVKVVFDDQIYDSANSLSVAYDTEGTDVPIETLGAAEITTVGYDSAGRVTHEIDALNHGTEYTYDDANRVTRAADVIYNGSSFTGTGPATDYTYDGNVITTTDALDESTIYTYDPLYRLHTLENPNGEVTTYLYDQAGNLTDLTDPDSNETIWEYDSLGRMVREDNDVNEVSTYRTYNYDADGRVTQKIDRLGRKTTYEYDNLGHMTAENWYNGATLLQTISYAFDSSGNLQSASDPNASYDFDYDALNREIGATQTIVGLTPTVQFRKAYDDASRTTLATATIGSNADFATNYTYDATGKLTTLIQSGQGGNAVAAKRLDLAYHSAGQLASIDRYSSTTHSSPVAATQFAYDEQGRVTSIGHEGTASGSTFAETHGYGYDDANRVDEYTTLIDSISTSYGYDDSGQLTSADNAGTSFDETYHYDDNGNRHGSVTNALGSFDYDALINQVVTDGTNIYIYNAEGNLTTQYNDSSNDDWEWESQESGIQYTWDYRNRLTNVTFRNGPTGSITKTVDYEYDAFNQLIKRTVDPDGALGSAAIDQTFYLYDKGQITLQFDKSASGAVADSNLSHRYLWGQAVDQLFADEQVTSLGSAGATYWVLADKDGSIRDMVDSSGDLRVHRRYDSFGNAVAETHYNASGTAVTTSQTGYVDEAFGFTGRLFDKATGLQNNLNRWYDPKLGRWMSEDPIGLRPDRNPYRYVRNSPTNYTDPSGRQVWVPPEQWGNPPLMPNPRPTPPQLPPPGTVPGPGWTPGPGWQWTPHPNAPGGGVWEGPGGQSLHPDCPHGDKPGHYDWNDPWGNGWEGYPVPGGPPQWKPKPGNNPHKPQPLFPPGTLQGACAFGVGMGIGAWFVYYVLPWLAVGGAPIGI